MNRVIWNEGLNPVVINVIDHTGLVVHAAKHHQPGQLLKGSDFVAVANPAASTLEVAWLGGACRFGPTVELTGDVDDVLVSIHASAGGGLPPGIECPAVGVFYGVTISLTQPVDQDSFRINYSP